MTGITLGRLRHRAGDLNEDVGGGEGEEEEEEEEEDDDDDDDPYAEVETSSQNTGPKIAIEQEFFIEVAPYHS